MRNYSFVLILSLFSLNIMAQDDSSISDGNNRFAADVYKQIKTEPVNQFYSPLSISSALAMTYAGAKGETLKQMSNTLYFSENQEELHSNFSHLIKMLTETEAEGIQLNIANSLWLQENMQVLDQYLSITNKYYQAGINKVNFITNPENSRKTINNWVEKNTNNKIIDLLPDGSIHSQTRMVLVNAIYFNGAWEKVFDKNKNTTEPFFVFKTCETQATFMNNYINSGFYEDNLLSIAEIPYRNKNQSMIIILPKSKYGLKEVEKLFEQNLLPDYFEKMEDRRINLSIPKFKSESTYKLQEELSKMGMPVAFSNNADFSGITGDKSLAIDKVIHKAFIDVNEEGTEAAAATAVTMRKTAILLDEAQFKADHPFIYLIKDNETNTILFVGRLMNPKQ
ncbi:MAG: serpin family protein [Bacteroidales bacterium]|nr:serpin family protein [Bacteroidales bacterium]